MAISISLLAQIAVFLLFQQAYITIDLEAVYTVQYVNIWNNPTQRKYDR